MKVAERQFTTISGVPSRRFTARKTPLGSTLDEPGEFPYTRGIHRDMYRGKLWTMRQFSGFATPEETNAAIITCWSRGRPGFRWRSICRR